jgi:hypothetical protein
MRSGKVRVVIKIRNSSEIVDDAAEQVATRTAAVGSLLYFL